jgi:hypothetical protein
MSVKQSTVPHSQEQRTCSMGISDMSIEQPSRISSQISLRSHHRDLQPLATNQTGTSQPRGYSPSSRIPESDIGRTPDSATSLASPTLAAVRQYYHDTGLMTALQSVPSPRQFLNARQDFPRRHSILSLGSLATHTGVVTVSSPSNSSPRAGISISFHSIAEESRQILVSGVIHSELARLGNKASERRSLQQDLLPHTAGKIPSEYTHSLLQEWGPIYLDNIATADVFVKAIHLQKPCKTTPPLNSEGSLGKTVDDNLSMGPKQEIVVRAWVVPKAKERKPFLIQRCFNLQAMRASSPPSSAKDDTARNRWEETSGRGKTDDVDNQVTHTRSKSVPSPELSSKPSEEGPQSVSSAIKHVITCPNPTERQTMPIR